MSNETILNVSKSLKKFIENSISDLVEDDVLLKSPSEENQNDKKLSLFLYKIEENAHLKNQRQNQYISNNSGNPNVKKILYPPINVDLYYIVTPIDNNPEQNQIKLAELLRLFHDTPILRKPHLEEDLTDDGNNEELRITLSTSSVDELNNLWNMFGEKKFRPSLTYMVSPVTIPSLRISETSVVTEKITKYGLYKKDNLKEI